ncbi:hypothetical protein FBU59_007162, partial [Linderina macrospora]
MNDFGQGVYTNPAAAYHGYATMPPTADGTQNPADHPGIHLPPIDPAGNYQRSNSFFAVPTSPHGAFDPMAAAAAASGAYSPHAPQGQYMATMRGQHYGAAATNPMMMGRFNMAMTSSTTSPALPNPPPLASSMPSSTSLNQQNGMPVPPTPTRSMSGGVSRVGMHGQSSTSQRKRYLCTVCQKMFARPSTLATHMHSHTGEKPYECTWDSCGKRFSVMSNLRRHQRIHERQRAKFANMQQQQGGTGSIEGSPNNSSGSTTPLAASMPN